MPINFLAEGKTSICSARPTPLKCKNECLMLALGEVTEAQAVVGSIFWTFRRLKRPRSGEMSARGYALYSFCPQLSFFPEAYFSRTSTEQSRFRLVVDLIPAERSRIETRLIRFFTEELDSMRSARAGVLRKRGAHVKWRSIPNSRFPAPRRKSICPQRCRSGLPGRNLEKFANL